MTSLLQRKYLFIGISLLVLGCTKARDTTYNFSCRHSFQKDPFTLVTKDTILRNITTADANLYIRNTSVNGWYTTCQRQ